MSWTPTAWSERWRTASRSGCARRCRCGAGHRCELAEAPFARGEIARLEDLRLTALELRIEAELALGRHAQLVGELESLISRHPFRERLRGQLMLALYRAGRRAEALEAYRAAPPGRRAGRPRQDVRRPRG